MRRTGRLGFSLFTTVGATAGAIRIRQDSACGCAAAKRAAAPPPHDIPAKATGPPVGIKSSSHCSALTLA
eukprot:7321251-Prymnesium_polylepis.1